MKKSCGECLFLTSDNLCQRIQSKIEYQEDIHNCPLYLNKESAQFCKICGRPILSGATYDMNTLETFCAECSSKYGTCALCAKAQYCAFQEDPNPLPKQVLKTFQKGPMVVQQQIPNPDRIAATCAQSCSCYSQELGCLRQYGNCNKFETII
jgi:hypothetical protein